MTKKRVTLLTALAGIVFASGVYLHSVEARMQGATGGRRGLRAGAIETMLPGKASSLRLLHLHEKAGTVARVSPLRSKV